MAQTVPPLDVVFHLFPLNHEARELVDYRPNHHLREPLSNSTPAGELHDFGLRIMTPCLEGQPCTLTTIGRNADILVPQLETAPDACISRVHCSFEIQENGEILLQDRSSFQNTQLFGPNAFPFERGRVPRRVLITDTYNRHFGFGNTGAKLFCFQIIWPSRPQQRTTPKHLPTLGNPRMMRTQDLQPGRIGPRKTFQERGPDQGFLPLRWIEGTLIGVGQHGSVLESLDVDSGRVLALKSIPTTHSDKSDLQKEINILKSLSHVSQQHRDRFKQLTFLASHSRVHRGTSN